jgi:PLP dependent protein
MSQPSSAIAARLMTIRQEIPSTVRLIAVSKQVSPEQIREAYQAGVRDFGESRVQEAIPKQQDLHDLPDITWHFIGRLQTNKIRKVLEHFQWIHSVDSLKLAERLNCLATELKREPNVCLQVKLLPDPTKQGWSEADLWQDLRTLDQFMSLKIRGLMIIPPASLSDLELKNLFHKAQNLIQTLNRQNTFDLIHLEELSMGMSGDYPFAIASGATMVRIGSKIFGDRA